MTQPAPEIAVADLAVVAELELDSHDVAAERIVVFVRVRGASANAHDGTGPRNDRGCAPGRFLRQRSSRKEREARIEAGNAASKRA